MSRIATAQGTIQFIANHEPALGPGDYSLSAALMIQAQQPDGTTGQAQDSAKLHFSVYGERFSLAPDQIQSLFPPPNASGAFSNVLPHAVLSRRSLPWERTPRSDGQQANFPNFNVGSWLALLVLTDTELRQAVVQTSTVAALLPSPRGTLPVGTLSTLSSGVLDSWETPSDPCRYLELPGDLFSTLAPSYDDLGWLAHARRKSLPAPDGTDQISDYAVVIANRFPRVAQASQVFLVSLEGLSDYLPDNDGNPSSKLGKNSLRLIVFASWRVTAAVDPFRFKELLEQLDGCGKGDDATLRLDRGEHAVGSSDGVAAAALSAGFTALPHATRAGDATISWYRGPFAPAAVPLTLIASALPASSADAVCAYDPGTGLFDVSYASAWSLGRLLGLADQHFAQGMYAFKQGLQHDSVLRLQPGRFGRQSLVAALKEALT